MRVESVTRRVREGLVVLAAAGLVACGSSTEPNGPSNGNLTAKIDGSNWSAATIVATYSGGVLAIAGTDGERRTIGFAVGPASAAGTFPVALTSGTNVTLSIITGSTAQGWHAVQSDGSGSVTLTTISANRAVGTFQFTVVPVTGTGASGNKSITEGVFDVTY